MRISLLATNPRFQHTILILSILNILIYGATVFWDRLGRLGLSLADIFQIYLIADSTIVWFCVSVLIFAPISVYVLFRRRFLFTPLVALMWCAVWIAELLWVHKFIVYD